MHLNAIALAAEEWGRVVETLVGSVSWRPFRHVTGTETEIFGHPPVTADRNERGSRSGSEFRSPVLQSRNGIVTAETAARPPTLPMETLSCHSWRTCTHTRAYEMTTRNVISSSRGDEEWRRIFIDRSIFLDASPALCFSALCIGACNRRWIAQLRAHTVCGGSRSLGRAGRASGTSQTLLLISFIYGFSTIVIFQSRNC